MKTFEYLILKTVNTISIRMAADATVLQYFYVFTFDINSIHGKLQEFATGKRYLRSFRTLGEELFFTK